MKLAEVTMERAPNGTKEVAGCSQRPHKQHGSIQQQNKAYVAGQNRIEQQGTIASRASDAECCTGEKCEMNRSMHTFFLLCGPDK